MKFMWRCLKSQPYDPVLVTLCMMQLGFFFLTFSMFRSSLAHSSGASACVAKSRRTAFSFFPWQLTVTRVILTPFTDRKMHIFRFAGCLHLLYLTRCHVAVCKGRWANTCTLVRWPFLSVFASLLGLRFHPRVTWELWLMAEALKNHHYKGKYPTEMQQP